MIFKQYLRLFIKYIKYAMISFAIFTISFILFSQNKIVDSFKDAKLDIAINDLDKSEDSQNLIDYLSKNHNVKIQKLEEKEAKKQIFENKIDVYIEIKENFIKNLKNDIKPIKITNTENSISDAMLKINLQKYMSYKLGAINSNVSNEELNKTLDTKIKVNITDNTAFLKEKATTTTNQMFSIASFIIISSITAILINIEVAFKNKEIVKRMKSSPVSLTKSSIQQYLGQIFISIFITALYIILIFSLSKNTSKSETMTLLTTAFIIYSIMAVSMVHMFVAITKDIRTLNTLVQAVNMVMGFTSGVFIPAKFLPKSIVAFSKFMPQYYFVEFINNQNSNSLIKFSLIQILFIVFFILLSIFIKKYKYKSIEN